MQQGYYSGRYDDRYLENRPRVSPTSRGGAYYAPPSSQPSQPYRGDYAQGGGGVGGVGPPPPQAPSYDRRPYPTDYGSYSAYSRNATGTYPEGYAGEPTYSPPGRARRPYPDESYSNRVAYPPSPGVHQGRRSHPEDYGPFPPPPPPQGGYSPRHGYPHPSSPYSRSPHYPGGYPPSRPDHMIDRPGPPPLERRDYPSQPYNGNYYSQPPPPPVADRRDYPRYPSHSDRPEHSDYWHAPPQVIPPHSFPYDYPHPSAHANYQAPASYHHDRTERTDVPPPVHTSSFSAPLPQPPLDQHSMLSGQPAFTTMAGPRSSQTDSVQRLPARKDVIVELPPSFSFTEQPSINQQQQQQQTPDDVPKGVSDDVNSLHEPERAGVYEDDDTIASDEVFSNENDLDAGLSKHFTNLQLNPAPTGACEEIRPVHAAIVSTAATPQIQQMVHPLDPRFWFRFPPPRGRSCLKGSPHARNAKAAKHISFIEGFVNRLDYAEYMDNIPHEIVWWTKEELRTRRIVDNQELETHAIAMQYNTECDNAYTHLLDKVKRLYDRKRNPNPDPETMWNRKKLAKILKPPIMTGLAFGYRGLELGGLEGQRDRTVKHLEIVLDHIENTYCRNNREARRNRRGNSLASTSEEDSLTDRLWAHVMAMADQVGANSM